MNMQRKPIVLMAGVGAVGAYFGGKLATAGLADLRVICRSDYHEVTAGGYDITSPNGDFRFMPDQVYRSAAECSDAPDYIIITAKVLPGIDRAAMIRSAVKPGSVIVLIQNGIEIEKEVKEAFPDNQLISCIAYVGVTRIGPGRIVHTDGGTLKIGVYPQGESPECKRLTNLFNTAGVPTECRSDIIRTRWEKLVWNGPFNPVSVLTRSDTSKLMADQHTCTLIRSLMDEIMTLSKADGWELPAELPEKLLKYTAGFRPYKPSMLIDFENSRPMEIDAILGNALKAADRLQVPVPCLRTVWALLRQLQQSGNSQD